MKNQMIGRYILAFLIATMTSSPAQEKNLQDTPCPKVKNLAQPAKAAFPKSAPKGIFALIPWGKAPEDRTWKDPCLDGVTIRRYWYEFNPARDKYDWGKLDRIFAQADSFAKKIDLIIVPGFYSPEWVIKRVDTVRFVVPHGPYRGQKRALPLPWSSTYLNLWFTFVEELAKRYGPKPALSVIAVTGPNSHNGEVNLPSGNKEEDFPDYDAFAKWKNLMLPNWKNLPGGTAKAERMLKDTLVAAYGNAFDRFYKAFALKHEKYLSLQIFNESLPVEREGDYPSPVQKKYHCELIELALEKLGKNFVLMNGGLEAWPVTDAVSRLYPPPNQPLQWERLQRLSDAGYVTGLMQKDGVDQDDAKKAGRSEIELFRLIVKNSIRFGADFLVIFEDDVHDKNFRDLIAAGGVLLQGKGKCE